MGSGDWTQIIWLGRKSPYRPSHPTNPHTIFLCMCACLCGPVCSCAWSCIFVQVHVCGGQRANWGVIIPQVPSLLSWNRVSYWPVPHQAGIAGSHGASRICLSPLLYHRSSSSHHQEQLLKMWTLDTEFRPSCFQDKCFTSCVFSQAFLIFPRLDISGS